MGIPGLKRVIEAFFPLSIRVLKIKDQSNTATNIILIDGNIALYSLKDITPDITPELLLEYCEQIAVEYNASEKIIVFDGMPPIQKLPEQIRRRKKKYSNLSELKAQLTFDLVNKYFINFLKVSEKLFRANGWLVKPYLDDGEGEQKIATLIRLSIKNINKNTECNNDINFIAWTKDWDMFIILLNNNILQYYHINIYLHMNLVYIPYIISIRKCQVYLRKVNVTPLHFMAIMLLFGSDFYPGLNNISLTTLSDDSCILEVVLELLMMKPYITYNQDDDSCNTKSLEFNKKRMLKVLGIIYIFHANRLRPKSKVFDSQSSSNESTNGEVINKVFKFISYSNVDSKVISIEDTECQRDCILCRPNRYSTYDDMTNSARDYIRLYLWTIYYFKGLLKRCVVHNSSNVYTSSITPSVKAIIRIVSEEDIIHDDFKINITHKDSYIQAIEDGLNLEYNIILPCQFIKTYNDDINISSQDLNTLSIFQ